MAIFLRRGFCRFFMMWRVTPGGFKPEDSVGFRLLFCEQDPEDLVRREIPEALTSLHRYTAVCNHWRVNIMMPLRRFHAKRSPIKSSHCPKARDDLFHEWRFDEENSVLASENGETSSCHRVGGWPTPVQNGMETECALLNAGYYTGDDKAYRDPETLSVRESAKDWLLIAQIGTDEKADMMWGDSGQLYVWIHRDDLRARDFGKARLILQCY